MSRKTVRVSITDSMAYDVLTTAVEGGICYWANCYRGNAIKREKQPYYRVTELAIGKPIAGSDAEGVPPVKRRIGPGDIRAAMQWLLDAAADPSIADHAKVRFETAAHLLAHFEPGEHGGFMGDANDADTLVQVAVFGRVVYG